MIVESRSTKLAVVHPKTERLDEMQIGARVGGEPNDITRIRRNLGMDEDDGKHGVIEKRTPIQRSATLCIASPGGGVRATTHASTRKARIRRRTLAASMSVAPVVMTSSTMATRCPAMEASASNAPRTLRVRASSFNPA